MRNRFSMPYYSMNVGQVGRLNCISLIPVAAGDSLELDMMGVLRMSPLRRQLALDPRIDICAFYRPHRHCYGDQWVNWLTEGMNENETFPTASSGANTPPWGFFGVDVGSSNQTFPLWIWDGFREIWNRYYRDPSDDGMYIGINSNSMTTNNLGTAFGTDGSIATAHRRAYGPMCCHVERPWNGGITQYDSVNGQTVEEDRRATTSSGFVDITHIAEATGRYRSRIAREWFAQTGRYTDLLEAGWSGHANTEADQRPELLMRATNYLGGYEVIGLDGTGDQNTQGKSEQPVQFRLPRKFYPEHGAIWVMMLVRYDPIMERETNKKIFAAQPDYRYAACDHDILAAIDPEPANRSDMFEGGSGSRMHSPAIWWQYQHNFVHPQYRNLNGYPFLSGSDVSGVRIKEGVYDSVFFNTSLAQWNSQFKCNIEVDRNAPVANKSIFVGAQSEQQ